MSDLFKDKNGLTEEEYLKDYNPDKWKKPSVTSDICIITNDPDNRKLLLVKRGNHPCIGMWALPGGFTQAGESIEETASRELEEETAVKMAPSDLELVGVYSKPGRDPRDWTISIAFLAEVDENKVKPIAGDDADATGWYKIEDTAEGVKLSCGDNVFYSKDLAFDHEEILRDALKLIRGIG
ncbi:MULTISPECIES: NUDIX domain-containing protein [unclassified Butyrivibrio]|uniref:NUDIX domain-containing protein n=1 Tax=unclassified Butyrivibrio TaxID=2639466 RepID=UPI0003B46CBC|nr:MULTISPECIES: NUDIX hydrolase [unclassified Butyrivibrio]SEL49310.1 ADP-ribose pyrophosphatase YjhB, NUDIX family [Butyrivibrio sp. ob235]